MILLCGSPSSRAAGLVWARNQTFHSVLMFSFVVLKWESWDLIWFAFCLYTLAELCSCSCSLWSAYLLSLEPHGKNPRPDSALHTLPHCLNVLLQKHNENWNYADSTSPLLASEIAGIPSSISEDVVELVWTIRPLKTSPWWWCQWDVKNVNTWVHKK